MDAFAETSWGPSFVSIFSLQFLDSPGNLSVSYSWYFRPKEIRFIFFFYCSRALLFEAGQDQPFGCEKEMHWIGLCLFCTNCQGIASVGKLNMVFYVQRYLPVCLSSQLKCYYHSSVWNEAILIVIRKSFREAYYFNIVLHKGVSRSKRFYISKIETLFQRN